MEQEGATMTRTSRSEESFSQLLLRWLAYQMARTLSAIEPAHRASDIAEAVAVSNNPSGT
jgi:hypothetical protein